MCVSVALSEERERERESLAWLLAPLDLSSRAHCWVAFTLHVLSCRSLQRSTSHSKSSLEAVGHALIPGHVVGDLNSEERKPFSNGQITLPVGQDLSFLLNPCQDAIVDGAQFSAVSPSSSHPPKCL